LVLGLLLLLLLLVLRWWLRLLELLVCTAELQLCLLALGAAAPWP
jgi:hypothetical protein